MLCNGLLRSASFLVGYIGRYSEVGNLVCICGTSKHTNLVAYWTNRSFLRMRSMMVDFGSTAKGTMPDFTLPRDEDGGVASGGMEEYFSCREKGRPSCGYSSFKGKRATMEDFFDIKFSEIDGQSVCLFGIFDGHGGSRAAEYLKSHLFENLMKHPEFISNTKLAISETYQQTDRAFLESEKDTSRDDGSTASTAVLVGNRLYVANVGDSRTIMSKTGKAIPLSEDHKPDRIDERKRIENAGGVVIWAGTWRVGGILAMSRAFGNRMLKQFVVAEPEIQEQEVDQDLEILVLASDGLWDVIPNEESILIGRSEEDPEAAARKLAETAFSHGSADNITCIVVKFHHVAPEPLDRPSHQEHPPEGSAPHPEPESQPAGTKLESKPEPSPPQGSAPHLKPESQPSGTELESKPKPNAKPTA